MRYKNNGVNNSAEVFARMTATINPVAIVHLFKATCCDIFEHLLAAGSKNRKFFGFVSTYFGIVETNSQGILYLHYLVWFCDAFHIS